MVGCTHVKVTVKVFNSIQLIPSQSFWEWWDILYTPGLSTLFIFLCRSSKSCQVKWGQSDFHLSLGGLTLAIKARQLLFRDCDNQLSEDSWLLLVVWVLAISIFIAATSRCVARYSLWALQVVRVSLQFVSSWPKRLSISKRYRNTGDLDGFLWNPLYWSGEVTTAKQHFIQEEPAPILRSQLHPEVLVYETQHRWEVKHCLPKRKVYPGDSLSADRYIKPWAEQDIL